MAISGILDQTTTATNPNMAFVDYINTKFGDKLIASQEVDTSWAYVSLNIQDKANGYRIMQCRLYQSTARAMWIEIFNHNGSVGKISLNGGDKGRWSIYGCSNGLLIRSVNESNIGAWAFITFNADGTIIYGTSDAANTGACPTSFKTAVWNEDALTTTISNVQAGATSLFNLVYKGEYGVTTLAENAYYAIYAQYPYTIGTLDINDNYYISNGWFVIAD